MSTCVPSYPKITRVTTEATVSIDSSSMMLVILTFFFCIVARVIAIVGQVLLPSVSVIVAVGVVESLQNGTFVEMDRLDILLVIVVVVKLGMGLVVGVVLGIAMLGLSMVHCWLSVVFGDMGILVEKFEVRGGLMGVNFTLVN